MMAANKAFHAIGAKARLSMNADVSGNEENMGMLAKLQGVSSYAKGKVNENTDRR